jgi:hypothetical protein
MSLDNLNKGVDIAAKLAAPIGVCIMLWLQSQFVTRVEFSKAYEKTDSRLTKIEEVLIRMEASAEVDRRHDNILSDHEGRVRNLEKILFEKGFAK